MSVIMDSSPFHQPGHLHRMHSGLHPDALHPLHHRAAVQKHTAPRNRSISTSQLDRLHNYALEQANSSNSASLPSPSVTAQWITPQPSPQPQLFPDATTVDAFANWAVPTPPRSDSGVPNVTFDSTDIPVTAGITASDFEHFQQSATASEMSSLGFLLPGQYGSGTIESEPSSYAVDQSYIPPVRVSQSSSTSGPPTYPQTTSTSPALYQSKSISLPGSSNRRESDLSHATSSDPSYGQTYRRSSHPYEPLHSNDYSMAPSPSIPSVSGASHSQAPSASSMAPPYNANSSRSPNLYDSGMYAQQFTSAPSSAQLYASSHNMSYAPPFVGSSVNEVLSKPLGSDPAIRVLNSRPKPQCWEHGCNGRQFSTFSNLLRHQREKSGTAAKSYCPKCGAEFTRTTARNGHLAHDKCTKQRQSSDDK